MILVPSTPPYSVRGRNSCSCIRYARPFQCSVEPPTAFTVHNGAEGDTVAASHVPVACRLSSQVSCPNAAPSSWMNSFGSIRLPASRTTTWIPREASSCATVPPPAPEPMMTIAGSLRSTKPTAPSDYIYLRQYKDQSREAKTTSQVNFRSTVHVYEPRSHKWVSSDGHRRH